MDNRQDRGIIVALDTGIIALLVIVLLAILNVSGVTLAELFSVVKVMVYTAYGATN